MKILKMKSTWTNWELGLIKASLISLGILVGIYLYDLLKPYTWLFWIVFIIFAIWTLILWSRKMK